MIKFNLSDSRSTPREMNDKEIDLVSTSAATADASPIILNKTEMIQTKFEPKLVNNENSPEKCISGKLIYEKKRKNDVEFPTEKVTRGSLKVGDHMEISLNTSETYELFNGLQRLYQLKSDIGNTPIGSVTYTEVDNSFRQFYSIIQNDPSAARLLAEEENYELVKLLLKLITQVDSLDSLKNSLMELGEANVSTLSNALNIEKLRRILILLKENLDNDNEKDWQRIFNEHQWILSQMFSYPYTIYEEKAYVGGKDISNSGGNICDFIYQNSITQNAALIEIKTPNTPLIGQRYRGTFSLSANLSGAINQVLNYKDNLTKEYYLLCGKSQVKYEAFNPKCFVLAGKITSLDSAQVSTLENYRNSLMNIEIITFDELIRKVTDMLSLFDSEPKSLENSSKEDIVDEDDLPF